ncbi:MAG: precorrin-8X methylmutase [Deltaproteobacteria bacterium]|nr:precorrin-8X methylmutase [Deltaproteobacteria bacterium]MBW1958296.1 precorrin-8X methylmutase [Deltaproteobacteria bacterium]MBW2014291.1 precorrin-8X methylmutase [Deltaproteobacteria bacterium]
MKPEEIETLSFKIIDQEAGPHNFSSDEWRIVQRMIHTSADFEYIKTVRFHPKAIAAGVNAIRRGKTIVTDTNMARAGIRKQDAQRFGSIIKCYINDPEVIKISLKTGKTRAEVAVDAALPEIKDGIYVIGNAPTALFRLIERVKENKARPSLIIGLPVGFVNAAESKATLIEMDYPYISNASRKGGSNIAASVVNALGKMAVTL